MDKIYRSQFKEVFWESDHQLISKKWFKTSEDMTPDEFKHEMTEYGKLVNLYKPKKELVDTTNFNFTITPELQEWVGNNVFQIYDQVGMKHAALLVSKEFIAQLSLEQAMDEGHGQKLIKRYFDNEKEARDWLTYA